MHSHFLKEFLKETLKSFFFLGVWQYSKICHFSYSVRFGHYLFYPHSIAAWMSRNSLLETWSLIDCTRTWTHNHLVCKWTLNHLAKLASLAKWLSVHSWTKWLWVQVPLQSLKQCIFFVVRALILLFQPSSFSTVV